MYPKFLYLEQSIIQFYKLFFGLKIPGFTDWQNE